MKRALSRASGFTLIEVLVAITIITIGILGIAGLAGTAVRSSGFSQALTQATNLAQDRIEALQSIDYNNLESTDNAGRLDLRRNCVQTSAAVNRPQWTCAAANTVTYDSRTFSWSYVATLLDLDATGIANNGDGLTRLDVSITWTDVFGNPKTLTVTTLRARG